MHLNQRTHNSQHSVAEHRKLNPANELLAGHTIHQHSWKLVILTFQPLNYWNSSIFHYTNYTMCSIPCKAVMKPLRFSSETNVSVETSKDIQEVLSGMGWLCVLVLSGFFSNKYTGFTSNQTISVPESSWGLHLPCLISKHLHIS